MPRWRGTLAKAAGVGIFGFAARRGRMDHPSSPGRQAGQLTGPSQSARTIARGLTIERDATSARIALVNATIETIVPELLTARDLMDNFHAMMRSKDAARLGAWIASAKDSKRAAFAKGVESDRAAVAAAIAEPWSSGQAKET